jgi:hypothetical protein
MTRRDDLGSASFMQASIREEECANLRACDVRAFGGDSHSGVVRPGACARSAAKTGRPCKREPGRLDESGGYIGFEKGADAFADRRGGVCNHAGGHRAIGSDKYSGPAADRAWAECGADQRKYLGDQRAWIERAIQQRTTGAGRRAQRVHTVVRRRLLGFAGLAAGEHRANRSDSRAGRRSVGRERGERRRKHHSKKSGRHEGRDRIHRRRQRDPTFSTVQYGGSIKGNFDYRAYAKYFDIHDMRGNGVGDGGDGWHMLRAGFRTDSALSDRDSLVVEGDMYTGREGDPTHTLLSILSPGPVPVEIFINVSGGYLESIWRHTASSRSDFTLTGTYDTYERGDLLNDHRKTESLDFKHHYTLSERNELVWGATYRHTSGESMGGTWLSLIPADQSENIFSVFVQDEFAAIQDKLYLTLGSKFENNTYSGFAAMPTARALYALNGRQSVWRRCRAR